MAHRKAALQVANDAMAEITAQFRLMHLPMDVLRMQAVQLVMSECAEMIGRCARQMEEHGTITDSFWRYLRENTRDLYNNVLAVEPLKDMPNLAGESAMVAAD
jgi:hypothetical protein